MIVEDRIALRHGVLSHECTFKQSPGYGYVVRFIKQSNEFVIRWSSFDEVIFHHYLPEVKEFIESFRFDTANE